MIWWIARHLPHKIRMAVVEQWFKAAVVASPKGMDSTLEEIHEHLKKENTE
jgi:hypothetical protein